MPFFKLKIIEDIANENHYSQFMPCGAFCIPVFANSCSKAQALLLNLDLLMTSTNYSSECILKTLKCLKIC